MMKKSKSRFVNPHGGGYKRHTQVHKGSHKYDRNQAKKEAEEAVKNQVYMFNGEVLTDENIEKARQFYIQCSLNCIKDAEDGTVFVNDLEKYREWQLEHIHKMEVETDFSLSFLQRAYYFQTGKSIALLPKYKK